MIKCSVTPLLNAPTCSTGLFLAAVSPEGAIGQSRARVPLPCAAGIWDLPAGLEPSACPRARGDPADEFIHWIPFGFSGVSAGRVSEAAQLESGVFHIWP